MSDGVLAYQTGHGPSYNDKVCSRCMGHRALCGVRPCPIVMRAVTLARIDERMSGNALSGSSPPGVFVGSYGYPQVLVGPLIPPLRGPEVTLMERPDLWLDKTLDEIMALRFNLVRTKRSIRVESAVDPPRVLAETQTLVLSDSPADTEATLLKRPQFTSIFTRGMLPIGPSAPLEQFRLDDNPHVHPSVDRVTSDTDMRAADGVMALFRDRIDVQHIVRLFSVGLIGQNRSRRLVPTEWSITAVDDIIGRRLHRQILDLDWISDYEVYASHALGNTVVVLMSPGAWQYEALECWLMGPRTNVISDHEHTKGRSSYASSVVGAYYAARLPVLEHLHNNRRQASVIVFLEIDPKQWLPLGVWRFREIARRALRDGPRRFSTLRDAIIGVSSHLRAPIEAYLRRSALFEGLDSQTQLTEY
ncbi:MAG: hypothetical protein QXS20_06425 [Candidatus Thorarchaeota archaeon]